MEQIEFMKKILPAFKRLQRKGAEEFLGALGDCLNPEGGGPRFFLTGDGVSVREAPREVMMDRMDNGAKQDQKPPLPRWKCHKVVEAFKIREIRRKTYIPTLGEIFS
ncbi:MAG: hypothetical protein ABIJ57_13890, partial [Pseudomonadota bacterium]